IVLDDQAISGQHCRIRPTGEGFVLHDLGSTNGTFVNGNRVTRHPLRPGDQIRVGASLIRFRSS
ncbi:MAG: FHA domain-containing protein, partial [Deltaproteobacteria bacterium]|nr:FHA domain-containing protein [Deltaproteobacteria bacterium]